MATHTLGLHHVTLVSGDPTATVEFYAGFLGLRLVKRTVNFDDPTGHHLYFGDEVGHPGSVLSFLVQPGATRAKAGTGAASVVSFAVTRSALGFWIDRLIHEGLRFEGPTERFQEQVVTFWDPDGLLLELVTHPEAEARPVWSGCPLPVREAIRGLHSVTLWVEGFHGTARFLEEVLGFHEVGYEGARFRFAVDDAGPGSIVDLRCMPEFQRAIPGKGGVHHVAWRVLDDEAHRALALKLVRAGVDVTPPLDRVYYHSLYFREPGGLLFEVSTDSPGFTADEPTHALGMRLSLPAWMEPCRRGIEAALPEIQIAEPARA